MPVSIVRAASVKRQAKEGTGTLLGDRSCIGYFEVDNVVTVLKENNQVITVQNSTGEQNK